MIEVLKRVVEALENSVDLVIEDAYHAEQIYANIPTRQARVGGLKLLVEEHQKAIKAGKQAIKELESQEPRNVRERWNVELDGNDLLVCFNDHEKGDKCQYERYSPQRTWVGLTDEEIKPCWYEACQTDLELTSQLVIYFARTIEAFVKLVADKRVEGMVMMTPDEFKSVWDKAQAEEREACAKVCDELYAEDETVSVGECVNAIRARGEA